MDSLVALDAQIISQLRDTNIQINRLLVLQLNRLHDTIKQLQQADSDTNNQDPRLPGRTQQLQTLLPTMKTTLEHQQTFYHQCLRLQHIPTTLHHQVLRLATTLNKTHTTSTPTFERSNTPPSPKQNQDRTDTTYYQSPHYTSTRTTASPHTSQAIRAATPSMAAAHFLSSITLTLTHRQTRPSPHLTLQISLTTHTQQATSHRHTTSP